MSTVMDFNTLKTQIVEEVKHSLSHYIENRVDELLKAFFAPLFVQKPEKESVSPLQSSKSSLSVHDTPVETSEEMNTATPYIAEHDDRSSTAASSRLSVLDKSSSLDFSKFLENSRKYYLPISEPMPDMKSVFVTFNDSSKGLLHIISHYRRQFCRVIPGFRSLYRQLVAQHKSSYTAYDGSDAFLKIQELQNLLFDYLNAWLKDENYMGQEKRTSGIRHMWKCNHPGEERVLVVGLSYDMFDSDEMKLDKDDVCQVITAFFVKKVDVNPVIMKPVEVIKDGNVTVPSDNFREDNKIDLVNPLDVQTSNVSDFEINKATLRVLLNGNDPTYLYRRSPCFGKMILPIGKHQVAKHEIRIMFNNVNQGILHLLIVCFDRFRKILPQFESLPAEVSTRRDILHIAGNVSHNIDFHGEDALIYLQCVVYSFLNSSMTSANYLGYESRSIGTRHIWSLPKSFEDNFVLALTINDDLVIEGNKCYYKVDTAFFLPLSHVKSYKMIQSSAPYGVNQLQSPVYSQSSIRRRRSCYDHRRNHVNFERIL
uniref:Uncharacterized protein n=1 Tax=Panagrolaimus sp. PS1159 TaxID=55785 RepID=A0AC35FZT7_9BILA